MTVTKIAATHILADYETERPAVPTIDGQLFIAATDGNVDIGLGGAWVSLLASLVITDNHAIHDNTAGEIVAITEKATPVDGDVLLMEDSQALYVKKRVRFDGMVTEGADIDITEGNVIGRGGDTILLYYANGDPVAEFAATEAGLVAALAAASSGDTVEHPSRTITVTSAIVVPAEVNYIGVNRIKSILQATTDVGAVLLTVNGYASNLQVNYNTSRSAGSLMVALEIATPASAARIGAIGRNAGTDDIAAARVYGSMNYATCQAYADGVSNAFGCIADASGGAIYGIIQLIYATAVVSNAGKSSNGLRMYSGARAQYCNGICSGIGHHAGAGITAGTCYLRHCVLSGPSLCDIWLDAGTTVNVCGNTLINGTTAGTGTMIYESSDRAAWIVGSLHAKDIADAALQRHNTVPGVAGKIDVSDGANWVEGDHGDIGGLADDDHIQYLLANGTRPLSADWDAGSWQIRAETLQSDIATGTAPLTVASTTLVTNLNAELHNGYNQSDLDLINWMF